ncbi:MAG: DUF4184 family protein [Desulfamplus sp.]|nr:DUF4184 family protein [Desulfamplus sp.]
MPATPFHIGAALVVKPVADNHFSVITFSVAQILMDIEPLIGLFRNSGTLHGVTHTIIGAIIIAILAALISPCICRLILGRFNREVEFYKIGWLSAPETASPMVIYSSAYFGTLSHLLLDSFIYYDIHPFIPFSDSNPFLNIISQYGVYYLCSVSAVVGAAAWVIRKKMVN